MREDVRVTKRRKAARKKRRLQLLFSVLFLILVLGLVTLWLVLPVFHPERALKGTWQRRVDLTPSVQARGEIWLSSAEDATEAAFSENLPETGYDLTLELLNNSTYKRTVNAVSFGSEQNAAYEALASALHRLLVYKAKEAGKEDFDEEEAKMLVNRVLGMSTVDYLKEYGPELFPVIEGIAQDYESAGIYTTEKDKILWDGAGAQEYMTDGNILVLKGEEDTEVYYRKDNLLAWVMPETLVARAETHKNLENMTLELTGGGSGTVRTLHYQYPNNRYLSLRDVATVLRGTAKQFELSYRNGTMEITTGEAYVPVGGEGTPFSPEDEAAEGDLQGLSYESEVLRQNSLMIDGRKLNYSTFAGTNAGGARDYFMSLTDLCMLLNLHAEVKGSRLVVDPDVDFTVDVETLLTRGGCEEVHSALVGDASTGEVYAAMEPELSVPIASTTKLMTAFCVYEALSDGRIQMEDMVTLSKEAERLSQTRDGLIPMEVGTKASVEDLIKGMLLRSSNECALSLAIYISGSEEAFVKQMNAVADSLELSDATIFYNCHGLPVFADNVAASKMQNHMSARDMFRLVCHLLATHPEITEVTSLQSARLETLRTEVNNTNPTLYNVPGVVGLKTGTTSMAGACLVSAMEVQAADGATHYIVVMEFGAEDTVTRGTFTELLLHYGKQQFEERGSTAPLLETDKVMVMPRSAGEFIDLMMLHM